jgi:hypothetical protein
MDGVSKMSFLLFSLLPLFPPPGNKQSQKKDKGVKEQSWKSARTCRENLCPAPPGFTRRFRYAISTAEFSFLFHRKSQPSLTLIWGRVKYSWEFFFFFFPATWRKNRYWDTKMAL